MACWPSLIEADDDNGRVLACTLYARSGKLADPVYIHAKIAIIDDQWFTLGSANLNEHSLFNDTEMNVVTHDPELARERGSAYGRSISSCRPRRSRTILCARWTSSGNRSARSSSTGGPPACRSLTGS